MPTERSVLVRLKADVSDFKRGMREATDSIDKTNDRTAWLAQSFLALGPTLAPIGAAAVPVFTSIATQATLAGTAAVTLGLAFNGVGDALKALNAFQLEPTEANLQKLNKTMGDIGPEGERFVRFLDDLGPALSELSNTARGGVFPGMTEGIEDLMTLLPEFNLLIGRTATTLGDLSAEGGATLAGPEFEEFFEYLSTDGQRILSDMGKTLGNFFQGFTAMIVAFGPLTDSFSGGLREMSADFAAWSQGLDQNDSFQEFLAYIEQAGPKVLDLIGAMIGVLVQFAEAAAPVGDVMVPALTELLKVVSTLLDNPIAPWFIAAGAAIGIYGRASALLSVTTGGLLKPVLGLEAGLVKQTKSAKAAIPTLGELGTVMYRLGQSSDQASNKTKNARFTLGEFARSAAPAATAVGLLGLQASGAAEKMGLSNTAAFAMAGTFIGPWGTAIGAGAGLALDLADANGDLADSLKRVDAAAATGNIVAMNAELDTMKAKVDDINNSNGVGDYLSDQARFIGRNITNPLDALKMRPEDQDAKDAIAATEAQIQETYKLEARTRDLAAAQDAQAEASRKQASAMAEVHDSAVKSGNSFLAFTADVNNADVTLDQFLTQMRNQAIALEQFGDNAARAAQKGLSDGLIAKLNELGPAGALRMKQLADASKTEINRANRIFARGERAVKDLTTTMEDIRPIVIDVDDSRLRTGVAAIDRFLANVTRPRTIPIATGAYGDGLGILKHNKDGSIDRNNNPNDSYAGGGYTGPGGKYEPAGIVHKGEVVLPQEVVRRDWSMLSSRYGDLPGFASGGKVGGLKDYMTSELDLKYPTTLKQWNAALAASTKVVEKEKSAREDLLSKRDQTKSTVRDAFRTDPFGTSRPEGWEWMSAADRTKSLAGDPFSILTGDIAKAGEFQKYLKTLKGKGLDGGAFAALAETGDVEQAKAFAGMSKADITRYENLFKKRESLSAGVGAFAGQAAYGAQLADNHAELVRVNKYQAQIVEELEDVKAEIRHHGAKGKAAKGATGASVRTRKRVL